MLFFVDARDRPGAQAAMLERAEEHWAYMDGFADRLVLRGPTLSADGTAHTGSIHVIDLTDRASAERFARDEPYWLAGLYRSIAVTRIAALPARAAAASEPSGADSPSSMVLGRWQPIGLQAGLIDAASAITSGQPRIAFSGLLLDESGAHAIGLAAAVEAGPSEARQLLRPLAATAVGPTVRLAARRWRRGGRPSDT